MPGASFPGRTENLVAIGTTACAPSTYTWSSTGSVCIGYKAGSSLTSGDDNVAIGTRALELATTANNSVAIGNFALNSVTTGYGNIGIGRQAGTLTTTGQQNIFEGIGAGFYNTTGSYNVGVGSLATLSKNTTGNSNTCIGTSSCTEIDGGSNNVGLGVETLWGNISGEQIVAGDFSSFTRWSLGAGWAQGSGKVLKNADGTGVLRPVNGANAYIDYGVGDGVFGLYLITYTVLDYTVGSVQACFAGQCDAARSANGTYTWTVSPSAYSDTGALDLTNTLTFTPTNTSRFSLDNISFVGYHTKAIANNTALGQGAGYMTCDVPLGTGLYGLNNIFVGTGAGRQHTIGNLNTIIGVESFLRNGPGIGNVGLGYRTGYRNLTGNYNVFLGYGAGYYETGSSKLFIDNATRASEADARTKALVYGVFDAVPSNQSLTINGNLKTAYGIAPYGRTTPDGEWATFTPSFAAIGGGTISGGTVQTARYTRQGKTMLIDVRLFGFTITGVVSQITMTIPDSAVANSRTNDTFPYSDNGTPGTGALEIASGGTLINLSINLLASVNWSVSAGASIFGFKTEIEIQ